MVFMKCILHFPFAIYLNNENVSISTDVTDINKNAFSKQSFASTKVFAECFTNLRVVTVRFEATHSKVFRLSSLYKSD